MQAGSTLFQFGNNQSLTDRLTKTNPNHFDSGSTSSFTLGEGGDQTSPGSGISTNNNHHQRFLEAYGECNLLDPGATGAKFTWHRVVGSRVVQSRRLDRLLWNMEAQLAFPEAKVFVLPRLYSDYNPIMVVEEAGPPPDRSVRPLRFEAAWINREDYQHIWRDATGDGTRPMDDVITRVTHNSVIWNRNIFGNIFKRKQKLMNFIQTIREFNV